MLVRKALSLLNAAFAMAMLELISPVIPVFKQYRPLVSECNAAKQPVWDYKDLRTFKWLTHLTVLSDKPTIPSQRTSRRRTQFCLSLQ
jgi:hypothetical protein